MEPWKINKNEPFCENCGAKIQEPNQTFCRNCGIPLRKFHFDSEETYVLPDTQASKIWIWQGSKSTIRKKLIASETAKVLKNHYGTGYEILRVEEGNEPSECKIMIKRLQF
ncbi:MAG: zinc-ribbon domain-containing protein [Promethearchaeota archaeon]|jgi:hypothetical protein